MKRSDDFGDLAREFQGIAAPGAALVRAVEMGRRRLVRGMVLGGVFSALLPGIGIYVLWKERDAPAVVFAAMQIGVTIALVLFVSRSQRKAWNARSETTLGFLDLEIERRRDVIRRMRFLHRWLSPAVVAGLVLFHGLLIRQDPSLLSAEPGSIIGFGGAYVICAFTVWAAFRKKARYEREEAALLKERAALDDGEAP
jgi:hypothetical protein